MFLYESLRHTRTMDQMCHCYSTLPHLPYLGTELVGIDCCSFHFRYLYHKESTLVFLEKVEESGCPQRDELDRRHCFRTGRRLLRQYLHLPELPDSLLLVGEIIAGRRFSVRKQDELRSSCAEYTAFYAVGTTYTARLQL